jgi:prephenate dehydratase
LPSPPLVRYAYFGPEGTFTEQALRTMPEAPRAQAWPQATIAATLDAVRRGEADAAMVPIENSLEGGVASTLDGLASGEPLRITREVLLRVRFMLAGRPGTELAAVRRVTTFPHAAAQCRRWLAAHVPQAEVVPAASTAAAGRLVAEDSAYDAAITSPLAVQRYRLATLAEDIGDNPDAVTRFVLVGLPGSPPLPTGHDRTSLVAYLAEDHPGALLEILTEFAVRGVNLTRIESRPTGERLGRYCFSIDCEGHIDDARVGETLMGLRRVCADVRFLGSYPRADRLPDTPVRRGTSDAEFRDAQAWLSRIREGRTR